MGLFKKKADPISERARDLNAKIAELESRIKRLNDQAAPPENREVRFRSTAYPHGLAPAPKAPAPPPDPIFEKVDRQPLETPPGEADDKRRYNELGLRKYDLVSLWERLRKQWREPTAPNSKFVNYLAAGSVQGLRPLRYERRIERRRFIFLAIGVAIVLLGLWAYVARRH